MTKSPVRLTEYERTPAVDLTAVEAGELARLVPTMSVTPSWDAPGRFDLTPGSEVGVVALDTRRIEIYPKFEVDRVMFLISYALDPARWLDRRADYETQSGLVDAMAALFGYSLRRALKRGVLHGYRTTDEALTTVRGRIRFDEQLRRRLGATLPVEVRYDDFTADTELNRLLLAALRRLARLPLRSARVRSTLGYCQSALSDQVAAADYTHRDLPALTWNRLNQDFRPAADLAKLIIRSTSLELARDSAPTGQASGLIVNMNEVFEEFVRTALREALGLRSSEFRAGQARALSLDDADRVWLEPDLTWQHRGKCVFVGDAKYKRVNAVGVKHPDLYQLLAYAVALNLPAGLLVYAKGEVDEVVHTVRQLDKQLQVVSVDLAGAPEEILGRIEVIAELVRQQAGLVRPPNRLAS